MKFPGTPYGLKMACGENPKRVYGDRGGPGTRMGSFSEYRAAWIEVARRYLERADKTSRILDILTFEPDQGNSLFQFAPRILVNQADLAPARVLGPGSRIRSSS